MRYGDNIKEVASLQPDFMGFIFYPPSPRNAIGISEVSVKQLPDGIKAVGVFVDAPLEEVKRVTGNYEIGIVQLHGNETSVFCREIKLTGLQVIKAIRIPANADSNFFESLAEYVGFVDMFLFEPQGMKAGGNGIKFDWCITDYYNLPVPYLLSGGIGPEDGDILKKGLPKGCIGIDLNSKFEITPGVKDSGKLKTFIRRINE